MCGRTRCTLTREKVADIVGVPPEKFVNGDKYNPTENVGPGRYGLIILGGSKVKEGGQKPMNITLQAMRWGLIPSFTKASAKPNHFLMFNARSESLQDRPAFKRLLESKRCIVLCEGYYEWQQVDRREKQPYYFYRENSLMKFAGLYDQWQNEAGELLGTYTILTTAVAPELKWLHSRMPVILSEEGVNQWLSKAKFEDLKDLLVSYRSADLKWHPVDKKVGSMQFQGEECAKKMNIKIAGNIKPFFGVQQEKHETGISQVMPANQVKMEKKPIDNTITKEHNSESDTAFKDPDIFVPASSLLNKRAKGQSSSPLKSPNKRRRASSPVKVKASAKMGNVKSSVDPKQLSLDSFFGKG
ncbi:Uncharacterized conserved protein [Plasmopara halstedii]|uniref:Uncharacterized conserved protein n=1 Tax=Plasmopara halstedii TaxID=4781 RepID=A0A0P1AYI7_PLAHL|nr:Uncharacterized conserved protein [Plasmopara halstedii]CEG46418.1 Uncharacterized conserved protein [Plasmopara halstedii]|eukprot:XP_024582787.1 Uncharacterized conserved protein [Plasmopara halstedii]